MWYRIEGSTEPCPCGGGGEKWVRLAEAKPVIRVSICPTCQPELADLVSCLSPMAGDDGDDMVS